MDYSIEDQTVGGQDPYEIMGGGFAGEKVVVGALVGRHQGPAARHEPRAC